MSDQPSDAEAMRWALRTLANAAGYGARSTCAKDEHLTDATAMLVGTDRSLCLASLAIELQERATGHWTKEPPSEMGLYFVRGDEYPLPGLDSPVVMRFKVSGGEWWPVILGDADHGSDEWRKMVEAGAERWSVRIEEPPK